MAADVKAFTAVMNYLKKKDSRHTVIMIQVEKRIGLPGVQRAGLFPPRSKIIRRPCSGRIAKTRTAKGAWSSGRCRGSWEQVFGSDADEYFHAWSVARFVGQVAAAGKAVYPLPMYVNAALRDPLTHPSANTYESGGPTDNVIPIWKVAAPAIDLLAPDIYLSGSEKILKVIDLYDRPDKRTVGVSWRPR